MPTFKLTDARALELNADLVQDILDGIQFRNTTIDQGVFKNHVLAVTQIDYSNNDLLAIRNELVTRGIIEVVSS